MCRKYLYGIISRSNDNTLDIPGVDGSRPVYMIAYQDLSCIVSDYFGKEFSARSRKEVIMCLLAHQVVVEHVMKEHTVLPVKFGTVLATVDEAQELLSRGRQQFVDALGWIHDKVEVEVAATWDTKQVLREICKKEEIVRAWQTMTSKREQQILEERIRLGQMVKAFMDQRRDSYREQMISFLKPVAVDFQPNALVSDEMVMNVAFLVERAHQEEFDSRVRQLNDLFHDQINFRIIGPLPPYSFATVEVTRLSSEKIEEARQLLGLSEDISEAEVRRAYRHLAAETHPDRKPGDEMARVQFARLRQASDLLIAYCRGQAKSGGSLLINIRRLKDEDLHFIETGSIAEVTDG
ncbi:MAG: GvpL/GvpF family gas vesicle protein [Coprothermobacterota bacterium]|nr:GvpL/GvpF family gas vesicle protein [Coprothermobacterota bacterium]